MLSDDNEKRDGLPTPARDLYSKSLLYLVSRALDDHRKMPILGLPAVQAWQQAWDSTGGAQRTFVVVPTRVPNTKPPKVSDTRGSQGPESLTPGTTQATHGSFDNNITVLTETIERIAGKPLVSPMEWLDY